MGVCLSKEIVEKHGGSIEYLSKKNMIDAFMSGEATTWKLVHYIDWLELDDYSETLTELAATGLVDVWSSDPV